MMPRQTGTLTVEAALMAYQEVGAEPLIQKGLPREAHQWLVACEAGESELSPQQLCSAAWLGIEFGFANHRMGHAIQGKLAEIGERPAKMVGAMRLAHTLGSSSMSRAQNWAHAALQSETASLYVQVQSGLAYGAIPLFNAILAPRDQRGRMSDHAAKYQTAQLWAVSALHEQAIAAEDLSPQERTLAAVVAHLLIANNLKGKGDNVHMLPVPPRCYEDRSRRDSCHCQLWDDEGRFIVGTLASRTTLTDSRPVLDDTIAGDHDDDLALLHELHVALLNGDREISPDSRLGAAAMWWAELYSTYITRRHLPVLVLPDLKRMSAGRPLESVGEQSPVSVDLEPITYPKISTGQLATVNIVEWYGQLCNGRPFSIHEGLDLNWALRDDKVIRLDQLSFEEQLQLNRARLECALAVAPEHRAIAIAQLNRADEALLAMQAGAMLREDKATLYEAVTELLKLRVLGSRIRGNSVSANAITEEMRDLFLEICFERQSVKDKRQQERLDGLMSRLFHAILVARPDENLFALPTFDRERGNESHPGWDVTIWHVDSGTIDFGLRRKLRITNAVSRPMRQGDIAIVPASTIAEKASMRVLIAGFTTRAGKGQSSNRTLKVIDTWRHALQPLFDEALELIAARNE